jgi:hypothetical protein
MKKLKIQYIRTAIPANHSNAIPIWQPRLVCNSLQTIAEVLPSTMNTSTKWKKLRKTKKKYNIKKEKSNRRTSRKHSIFYFQPIN